MKGLQCVYLSMGPFGGRTQEPDCTMQNHVLSTHLASGRMNRSSSSSVVLDGETQRTGTEYQVHGDLVSPGCHDFGRCTTWHQPAY